VEIVDNFSDIDGMERNSSLLSNEIEEGKAGEETLKWVVDNADDPPEKELSIYDEAKKLGIELSSGNILKVKNAAIPSEWIKSPHSFFAFALERIHERYPNKINRRGREMTGNDFKRLFISAICEWQDLRMEYPQWLEERLEQARIEKELARAGPEFAADAVPIDIAEAFKRYIESRGEKQCV
jgi:hypothetical protein